MAIKQFCKQCKQIINQGIMAKFKPTAVEFEDGTYCEVCASLKVKKARGQK